MNDCACSESVLLKKIKLEISKRGNEDSNFIYAAKFHIRRILDLDLKIKEGRASKAEKCKYLLSKMFLDNMHFFPTQPFVCRMTENSDWPVKPLPSEFFSPSDEKQSYEDRMKWFHFSLKVSDVLDCIVSKISGNYVQLKVLHKYGSLRILNDLSIMVTLIYIESEMQFLGNTLLDCEFVRVAVSKIDKVEEKVEIYVTADPENVQPFRPLPKLGKIVQSDIPFYNMKLPEKFPTYADYLNSKVQFNHPHFYSEIFKEFGINPYEIYSYFPKFNRQTCPEEETGQALLKKSQLNDANIKAQAAVKSLQRKRYSESLALIEEAIKVCPEKEPFQSKLYFLRSEIYEVEVKPGKSIQSFLDLERAYFLNPQVEEIKKKYFQRLFVTANVLYCKKDFKTASDIYQFLLYKDEDNPLYLKALNHLKKKNVLDFEDDIIDLEEKKKELLSELNSCEF